MLNYLHKKIKCTQNCGDICWCLPDLISINLKNGEINNLLNKVIKYYSEEEDEWFRVKVVELIKDKIVKVSYNINKTEIIDLNKLKYKTCDFISLNNFFECKYCKRNFNKLDYNYHTENNKKCKKRRRDDLIAKRILRKKKQIINRSKFKINEKVFAHWNNDKSEYFLGRIININLNGTYDIIFDDGYDHDEVKETDILGLKIDNGGIYVTAKKQHTKDGGKYYEGRIIGINKDYEDHYIVKFNKINKNKRSYSFIQYDVRFDEIRKKNYCCDHCSLNFSNKRNLNIHIKKHHNLSINDELNLFSNMIGRINSEN